MQFCIEKYEENLWTVVNLRAKSEPFKPYMFDESVVQSVAPLSWWKSQTSDSVRTSLCVTVMCEQLLGASASSAERIFSTFGIVNSFEIEKQAGCLFCSKTYIFVSYVKL